jgi:hypothetical protein
MVESRATEEQAFVRRTRNSRPQSKCSQRGMYPPRSTLFRSRDVLGKLPTQMSASDPLPEVTLSPLRGR